MMRPTDTGLAVYLCRAPVDFRKSIDGLAALIDAELGLDPFAAALYVFINRRRDKLKLLYWERNGFCLWYKRLERERFAWPVQRPGEAAITLTVAELNFLLDGFDLAHWRPHQRLHYAAVR
jgi:transposase